METKANWKARVLSITGFEPDEIPVARNTADDGTVLEWLTKDRVVAKRGDLYLIDCRARNAHGDTKPLDRPGRPDDFYQVDLSMKAAVERLIYWLESLTETQNPLDMRDGKWNEVKRVAVAWLEGLNPNRPYGGHQTNLTFEIADAKIQDLLTGNERHIKEYDDYTFYVVATRLMTAEKMPALGIQLMVNLVSWRQPMSPVIEVASGLLN